MNEKRDWRSQVSACLGAVDNKFALHPKDEERAVRMVSAAREAGASDKEILEAIEGYLREKGMDDVFIYDQQKALFDLLERGSDLRSEG